MYHPFTGRRWGHVFAISECDDGGCLHYEPLAWGTLITHYAIDIDDLLTLWYLEDTTAIVGVMVDYSQCTGKYIPRGIYTCVSAIKSIIGIKKSYFVLTPKQLYKKLIKLDNVLIFKRGQDE